MSNDAAESRMQDRRKGFFLLVNTLKLSLVLSLLPLAAGLVFGLGD